MKDSAVTTAGPRRVMRPAEADEVTWTHGFWADRVSLVRSATIPSQRAALHDPENAAYLPNFEAVADAGATKEHFGENWGDGDCYKYLETLVLISARFDDEALLTEVEGHVSVIARAQDPDGYISTNVQLDPTKERWSVPLHHELYNMGHLMTAAATHAKITGQSDFLDVAVKAADYLHDMFVPMKPELTHFGWNLSIVMGMVDLYRVTEDPRHIELARIFADMPGSHAGGTDQLQDAVPLRRESYAVGHAVTGPYLYAGATDVAAELADSELLEASMRIWRNVVDRRMYITGGVGAHHQAATPRKQMVWEAFGIDYELPNSTAYNETCANLALGMWSHRLAGMTGEAEYSDIVERVMYNAGASGMSLDGRAFCYTNPLRWYGDAHQLLSNDAMPRWERFTCYCCPVQVGRTTARMHEWFYGVDEEGVWIHQFGGSRLATRLPGGAVELEQVTDYPWDGSTRITINSEPGDEVAVRIRIPGWAESAKITLNGESVDEVVQPGRYFSMRRMWAAGDVIEIALPMEPTFMVAHPRVESALNHAAIMAGPVVYCLESADLPPDMRLTDAAITPDATLTQERDAAHFDGSIPTVRVLLKRREGSDGDELYRRAPVTEEQTLEAALVPYFAWGNRGPGEMAVWLPVR